MMLKRTLTAALLVLLAFPLSAQERTQTHVFRFVPGEDMFYIPWSGNRERLDTLLRAISANMKPLTAGERYICVSSYGARGNDTLPAARMAFLRCQRVKSELIVRGAATESMFLTDRHIAAPFGDSLREVVVVTFPATVGQVAALAGADAAARVEAYDRGLSGEAEQEGLAAEETAKAEREQRASRERADAERAAKERLAAEQADRERAAAERAEQERLAARQAAREQAEAEQAPPQAAAAAKAKPYTFALRANLLRWATLTPDVGIEWRASRSVGVVATATYIYWSWDAGQRRYSVLDLSPEVRWYLGRTKRGYVGAMFQAGNFNYKFSETGRQGDHLGGGLTGGYQLPIGKHLMLDFGAGVGYVHADYEKYRREEGHNVRTGKGTKNYWGPTRVTVGLVWTLGGNGNK